MSNVFEVLKRMGGVVVEENGVTYVTHPNPPANDDSQKIATTAWVRDITDGLEESVSGGMFPKVQRLAVSGDRGYVPSGGTWWCFSRHQESNTNNSYPGGTLIHYSNISSGIGLYVCIKIA